MVLQTCIYCLCFKRKSHGKGGMPWSLSQNNEDNIYSKGICPVAESLQDNFLGLQMCMFELNEERINDIICALEKFGLNILIEII